MKFLLILLFLTQANAEFIQKGWTFYNYKDQNSLVVISTQKPEGIFVALLENVPPDRFNPEKIPENSITLFLRFLRGKLYSITVNKEEYLGQNGLIKLRLDQKTNVTIFPSGFTVISKEDSSLGFLANNFLTSFSTKKLPLDLPSGFSPYVVTTSGIYLNDNKVPSSALGTALQSTKSYCFQSQVSIKDPNSGSVDLSNYVILSEPYLLDPKKSQIFMVVPTENNSYDTHLECQIKPL